MISKLKSPPPTVNPEHWGSIDISKIKTLIEMLEASDLNEIEVTQGEESVRIRKSLGVANTISDENSIILNNNQNL